MSFLRFISIAHFATKVHSLAPSLRHPYRNILILDHLNINHQKTRHDQLKAFYFDFLNCGIDPRKVENMDKGKKTLWANIGAQQFHLPEGKPDAQVLKGEIRLCYDKTKFQELIETYHNSNVQNVLKDSHFDLKEISSDEIKVTDPWGSKFKIVASDKIKDVRGLQNNVGDASSLGTCMDDLTIHTPSNTNMAGIARFYDQILDAPILDASERHCIVSMGPYQTLTFQSKATSTEAAAGVNMHVDLRDEPENSPADQTFYPSNYGPHISIYIRDIRGTYKRAQELGITYVNPRFSRKAYNEEEVVKDCMFRVLDVVDPEDVEAGAILRLEHEVRSVLKGDGGLYKSCPFEEAPEGCII